MVNPNRRIKRPDGLGKVYRYETDEDENVIELDIIPLLKDKYIYLYRAINEENFYIEPNASCFFIKEILDENNEVVGFATYRGTNVDEASLVMQYIYILPEFRGKGLLPGELDESMDLFESRIFIEYPNKYIVNSLIKYQLARVYDDRFVISRIPFMIPMVDYETSITGVTREEFDKELKGFNKASMIYDLDLCAVVGLATNDSEKLFNDDVDKDELNDYNCISLALNIDKEDFDCVNKRLNDKELADGTYFNHVRDITSKYDDVIQNWLTMF